MSASDNALYFFCPTLIAHPATMKHKYTSAISISLLLLHGKKINFITKTLALLVMLIVVSWQSALGQVSGYTFSQATGTYSAIAGTSVHASGWDDPTPATVTIPFTFNFNGTGYTTCSVNGNGYITFGSTASTAATYAPISQTTGYAGAVSALGRDLVSNSSTIVQGTTGVSPNRALIVQWNNARRYSGASVAADFNFQIRLYEGTNVIEIMYGACNTAVTTDIPVQVGLRGAANTDYNNRSLASGTLQWSATSAGASNAATCNTRSTNTQVPTSGLTFRWTPPTCSGTPTAPTAAISVASGAAGTAFNLTYSGGSTGSPFSNLWQFSYDNVNWTDWGTNSGTPFAASAQSTLYARVKRTCNTSGLQAFSNVVTYTVTSWNMTASNSAYACSGIFYDSGGSGGSYGNSQDFTYTFYPAVGTTGQKVRLTFTAFATENLFDGMMIYNGNSIAAPLISSGLGVGSDATTCPAGSWRGSGSPGTITSTAADGSLTIRFRSDNLTIGNGWAATVSCFNPCTVPTSFSVTGGGTRCASGAGLAVGLSGSQSGLSYQLFDDGVAAGSPVAGTGSAISFGTQTAAGVYTVQASASGFCTTTMTGSVTITVDPVPVLGTLNNTGPVSTCDHLGNIAQVTLSGFTGTPQWEYGDAAGNWYPWVSGANAGTCCFYPNPGADRMRVRVQSGVCAATAYTSTILVQNRNAPAPTSLTSTVTSYCLAARPANITLTATFPASGDMLPTVSGYTSVEFFSTSCGTGSLGTGTISGNTATLTIAAPTTTTTYFARATSSCETSTCAQVTVTVNDVPAQPSTVTGLAAPCSGSSQAYSVTNAAGVTYTWAFPGSGWSITGGTGTSAITVTVGSGTGNITVTPSNICGNGTARTFAIATSAGPTVTVSPSAASACGGVGVSLTASGASTYTWSPATGLSATSGAIVTANPSSNTTYTVTETSSGCNNTATVVVKAGPTVNATAAVNTTAVCPGGAVNLTSSGAEGTVTLIDPAGDGGFELGTTFAANGWTVVNSSTNNWVVGTATIGGGARSAYISNNGTANSYTTTTSQTVHLVKSITVPAGVTNINLSFLLKSRGEGSNWDQLLVYRGTGALTAGTPSGQTTTLSGYTNIFTQPDNSTYTNYQTVNINNLPVAGTTFNLVFTWKNDNATGTQPPASVDNISLTYTPPAATYSYAWSSSPAGFTSSAQNPTANPSVATTYTVTVTNTTSGCSDVASTSQVNMNAVPQGSLTAGGTVCAGEFAPLTFTATSGTGPFFITYNPSSQNTTGVVSGTPFNSQNGTSTGTNTYALVSVTSANGCTRSSGFTGSSASVTGTAAPTSPTAPTSSYNCSTGAVTMTTTGAGAGEGYRWYNSITSTTVQSTSASYTVTPTNSTNYYVTKYYTSGGACESPRMGVTAFADGIDAYAVTRNTGVGITDISSGGSVPTWRNGTSDDNLSQNLNIGFSFPFDGAVYTQFRMSSEGFITFNTVTPATGADIRSCGDAENYSYYNNTFSLFDKLGTVQSLAPFYDDLQPNGQSFANSFHYRTDASPNRLTVQWRGMSKYVDTDNCTSCSYGNYNFQVIIYETGNIEFAYGTMSSGADEDSKNYTCGINSSTISSTLNTAKLFTQQTANSITFSSNPVNNLSTVPTTNSKLTFTRSTPIAPTAAPTCIVYNFPENGATNQCTNSILSWSPVDGLPTGYDVYFGTNNPPTNIINGTNQANTYLAPSLASNTTYYWRIVPRNALGAPSAASMPIWSFSTGVPNVVNSITSSAGTNLCVGATTTLTVNGSLAEGSVYNWTTPVTFLGFEIASCQEGIPYPLFDLIFDPYACEANSRTLTFTSAGTYKFDVYAIGCNGATSCKRITIAVSDNANTAPTTITSSAGNTLCNGTSTTLTATGGSQGSGASYQWYTGSCGGTLFATTSSNTVTVAPTVGTTYFVRLIGGSTCPNTTTCATLAVSVQNAIANNTISGNQSICSGASPATLTGSTPTGGSGSYTYSWEVSTTSGTAGFNAIGSTNTIDYSPGALSQGTWYRRTVTSGSCTTPNVSNAIQITINPDITTPTFTAGATTLCAGATSTYTATVSNGTVSYSVTGGASINASSGAVTSVTSDFVVTATGTGCNGPTTATRSVTVTPNVGTPTFTAGNTTLCTGGTDNYTATVSNGTITYSVTGGASIDANTGTVSSVTSDFVVTATAAGCGGTTTATRNVTVTGGTTPSVAISNNIGSNTVCVGLAVNFTATPTNGGTTPTYQWTLNGNNIATGSSYNNSALLTGDVVAVEMTSNASCLSTPTATDSETMTVTQPNLAAINGSVSTPMATSDYLWAGNTTNNWTTAANWYVLNSNGTFSLASAVPTTATNVFVVSNTLAQQCVSNSNNATINATSNANNVTIGTAATVTVVSSNNLNVAGNWVSQGTFTPATGSVTFTGSGNRTILSYGNKFYNLVVDKTSGKVTISDVFEATQDVTVTTGTFELATGIIGKAKNVINNGGDVRIKNNGQLRVNN